LIKFVQRDVKDQVTELLQFFV